VAIQLSAQEAKAWARIGDRRQAEVALDKGRRLLEAMPYPDNLDHHFVVDPTKFDFYMMDCYRHLAEDRLAETLANEVIQASTDFGGRALNAPRKSLPSLLNELSTPRALFTRRVGEVASSYPEPHRLRNGAIR
jgi:hypothetical protein